MSATLLEPPVCHICGIPADASYFDFSRIVPGPAEGEEVVLAEYALHRNYCDTLLYFARFTDLYARDPSHADTPEIEWEIRCNGQPRDPYLTFDRIINPWGLSGFPIRLRLEPGSLVQFVARKVGIGSGPSIPVLFGLDPSVVNRVGGRLPRRYSYNSIYGREPGEALHRR